MCDFISKVLNGTYFDWGNVITSIGLIAAWFQWKNWKKQEVEKMQMSFKGEFLVTLNLYIVMTGLILGMLKKTKKDSYSLKIKLLKNLSDKIKQISVVSKLPLIEEYYPELSQDFSSFISHIVPINITKIILIDSFDLEKEPQNIESFPNMMTSDETVKICNKLVTIYQKQTGKIWTGIKYKGLKK